MSSAKLWTPTAHPAQDGLFAMRLGFELDATARARYVAAFLLVRFDDPRVEALELRMDPAEPAPTEISVPAGGLFGWAMGDPEGSSPVPLVAEAYAALRAPAGVDAFTGTMRLDATRARPGLTGARREHLRAAGPVPFALRPPEGWTGRNVPPEPEVATPRRAAVRLCVAADLQRYSRFGTPEAIRAQQRFVAVLARARRHAGIDEAGVDLQRSGDGEFAILPAGVDESVVIPRLVEGLAAALGRTNSDLSERALLRIRIALHRGHVAPGPNGWAGTAPVAVHRLLDSEVLRTALDGRPDADFALIVPDVLYQDVVADHFTGAEFTAVAVTVPAKGFAERAWIHLP